MLDYILKTLIVLAIDMPHAIVSNVLLFNENMF